MRTPVVFSRSVCSAEVIDDEVKFVFDLNSFESFETSVKAAIARYGHRKIDDPVKHVHVTTSTKVHVETLLSTYERVTGLRRP